MSKYTKIVTAGIVVACLIGYAIAEVPYWMVNHPTPVKRDEVSYNDKFLEMGMAMLGYLHADEVRELQRG